MAQPRILFITLSNIGDAIMTTPVLQALHDLYPAAIIDIVADRRSSAVFLHCPWRDRIFHKDKQGFMRGLPALLLELRQTQYDLIVDLRTEALSCFLRGEKKLGKWHSRPYGPHAVEKHMGVIHSLHGRQPIPGGKVWTGGEDEAAAHQMLGEYAGKKLLGIGPGANFPGKIWPPQNFLRIIDAMKDTCAAAVLLGDAKDQDLALVIGEKSPLPCLNLCGRTTLLQAAAVLRQTALFIGNDSGLGHLASAVNTPTVTLFGMGQPERYRPWGEQARWLVGRGGNMENLGAEEVITCIFSCPPVIAPARRTGS